MFSYYGSKSKVVQYYPHPMYDTIIEPFAGSARYSLYGNNWKKSVVLVDKYDVIVNIWRYLIKTATYDDVMSMPDISDGGSVSDFKWRHDALRMIAGFTVNRGSSQPKNKKHWCGSGGDGYANDRSKIASSLSHISHWEIVLGDYRCLSNIEATWFIDPPYQFGGEYYRHSNKKIDYKDLRNWIESRRGQVIVCENTRADWMPFRPLKVMRGAMHTTTEAMWTNIDIPRQSPLFDTDAQVEPLPAP